MHAEQKLKHIVLLKDWELRSAYDDEAAPLPEITADNIDALYDAAEDNDGEGWGLQDARGEVRGGEVETGIKCDWSRHYESKAVAAQYVDGSWVGWTYWYGGGKHGEPEGIDWIEHAYDLDCVEEEKVVTLRTFSQRAPVDG